MNTALRAGHRPPLFIASMNTSTIQHRGSALGSRKTSTLLLLAWALLLGSCGGGGGGQETNGRGAPQYPLSGTVTGLEEGDLEILNGPDRVRLTAKLTAEGKPMEQAFQFRLPAGAPYDLKLGNDTLSESGLTCGLTHGIGHMQAGPVGNVQVTCNRVKSLRRLAGQVPLDGERDGLVGQVGFYSPTSIALDKGGNLYVVDQWAYTIRKVSKSGAITTLAGKAREPGFADGEASVARFKAPQGIGVDAAGNVYVGDSYTIRRISPTGKVSTIAGTYGKQASSNEAPPDGVGASAIFEKISSLAVAPDGTTYVAGGDHGIRRVTPEGAVTTLKDSQGKPLGIGAVSIALDAAGIIYTGNRDHTVHRIGTDHVDTLLAGKTNESGMRNGQGGIARFSSIQSISAAAPGGIYIADRFGPHYRSYIRHVDVQGKVTTVAGGKVPDAFPTLGKGANLEDGQDQSGFVDGPGLTTWLFGIAGSAVTEDGRIFAAETDNQAIRRISPTRDVSTYVGVKTAGWADGPGRQALFNNPNSMVRDKAGNLYVADTGNHVIRRISPSGVVSTVAGKQGDAGWKDGTSIEARFYWPARMAIDANGNLFVTETFNETIRKITPEGRVSTFAGGPINSPPTNGLSINTPGAIGVDSDGNLYFIDVDRKLHRITSNGVMSTIDTKAPVSDLAIDASRNLIYVVDEHRHTVSQIDLKTGTVSIVAGKSGEAGIVNGDGEAARFTAPSKIAVDDAGNLYVVDDSTLRLLLRDSTNRFTVSTLASGLNANVLRLGPLSTPIGMPKGLVVTPTKIYFTHKNAVLFMDR